MNNPISEATTTFSQPHTHDNTKWKLTADWSAVRVGDSVQLENADGSVEFTVHKVARQREIYRLDSETTEYFETAWNLFVQATPKPEPVLPSEPRTFWCDRDGDAWVVGENGELLPLTAWPSRYGDGENLPADAYAPFTRLAPVPETAGAVLARVREIGWLSHGKGWDARLTAAQLNAVAAEFGVSDA